jgi:hypothetical protein
MRTALGALLLHLDRRYEAPSHRTLLKQSHSLRQNWRVIDAFGIRWPVLP